MTKKRRRRTRRHRAAPKRKRARSATKKPAAADDGDDENKNDGDDDAAAPAAAPPKRSGGKKPKLESAASSSAAADYILPASRPTNSVMPGVYTFHTLPPAPAGTAGTSANPDEVKIITWNVAGIKAALGKGMLAYIAAENPDVVCLQETKTVGEPDGGLLRDVYPFQYWSGLPAGETKKSKYYGGVALLSKIAPVAVSGEIGVGMPMDGEGRAVVAEFRDFHLINTYVPNASTALARLPDKQKYNAALETLMNRLDKTKPVLWTGDLNVSHKEIDLANPKTNTKSPGFTPEERADFSRILAGPSDPSSSPAFVDVWRHLNPNVQDYSYFSYRFAARAKYIGWRLDYFVVSRRAVDNGNVRGCVMRTEAYGAADHVPVVLGLRSLRL
ncbi:Endonuclease/exonuclease/phosphatase [Zopfochytrium polystomum]|nr:Endonuclease/exonuclease/phosphatase [Zopfochytrium polystomum]